MKSKILLAALVCLAALPGLALATTLADLTGRADCDGWSAEAVVHFGSVDRETVLHYTVTLTNVDTQETMVHSDSEPTGFAAGEFRTFSYSGSWGPLCGTFDVVGEFTLVGVDVNSQLTFSNRFVCTCDEPGDGCFRTPGYWKTHPDDPAWPDGGFAIGGVHHSNAELVGIMMTPVRGDATVILAHHLIAAKLNALAGEDDPDFAGAIADGDDMLVMYPLGSRPSGGDKHAVLDAKDALVAWNELGCDDHDMDASAKLDGTSLGAEKSLIDTEPTTWGELKSRYR